MRWQWQAGRTESQAKHACYCETLVDEYSLFAMGDSEGNDRLSVFEC